MYSLRRGEDGQVVDARIVPKCSVVIRFHENDMFVIRRDRIARVWTSVNNYQADEVSLFWIDLDGMQWEVGLRGGVAAKIFGTIVNCNDDVVWLEEQPFQTGGPGKEPQHAKWICYMAADHG